jgi:hypothetical protein
MKTTQKLLIFCLIFFIIFLSCCITMHQPALNQPQMSFKDATNSIKGALSDAKNVTDIAISEKGFTLLTNNNEKKYYEFNAIKDPFVYEDNTLNQKIYLVILSGSVWTTTDDNCIKFNNSKSARTVADALYYLKHHDIKKERERGYEDCLRLISQTPIDLILAGATAYDLPVDCSEVPSERLEPIINDILIEWKSKGLRGLIQNNSQSQLSDLIIKMEKGILKLDLKAKQLKDLADEEARQVQAPGQAAPAKQAPGALTTAHLLEQRQTILTVILGSVKQAAAQRAESRD